jgi:hypothetical protein
VGPVPDPLLRKCGSDGNRTRTSGSVARNSDHHTTEAVRAILYIYMKHLVPVNIYIYINMYIHVLFVQTMRMTRQMATDPECVQFVNDYIICYNVTPDDGLKAEKCSVIIFK